MMLYIVLVLCLVQWTNGEDGRGGEDTPSTPDWLASLEMEGKTVCLGALIHPKWIMASATCAKRGIATVSLDNCGEEKKDNCKLRTSVAKVVMHPAWWGGAKTDDIALIQLKERFPAGRILKLSNKKRDTMLQEMDKQECYELDWVKGNKEADHLPVGLTPDSACDRMFQSHPIQKPVCSISTGSCPRQSKGNPTLCKLGKRMFLVGFTAASKNEGNRCITALTRASRYHPWIRNTKRSADKTNVRTGDRCVPMTEGSPCAERGAVCSPGPYSYRCRSPSRPITPPPGPPTGPPGNQSLGDQCWADASPRPCADVNARCQRNSTMLTCQCRQNYRINDQNVCSEIPPPPPGNQSLGDQCWADASPRPCADVNARCQRNSTMLTCQCRQNYRVNDQNVCSEIPPPPPPGNRSLGDQCWADASPPPCADVNAICQSNSTMLTCQCSDNYVANYQNVCAAGGKVTEGCSTASECGLYMECQTSQCQCRMGYADRGDGYCHFVGYEIDMPCLEDSDCADNNTICWISNFHRRCVCKRDFVVISSVCQPCPDGRRSDVKGSNCRAVYNYNDICEEVYSYACPGESDCVRSTDNNLRCVCPFDSVRVGGRCNPCPEGQGRDPRTDNDCRIVTNVGEPCSGLSLCPEHAACVPGGGCTCVGGRAAFNGSCYEVSASYNGGECAADEHCQSNKNQICAGGICVCEPGYSGIHFDCKPYASCAPGAYTCQSKSYSYECINPTGCNTATAICQGWAGGWYLDGYCNMPHGFICFGDYQCDETLGLGCSDRKHCECLNGMEWRDSTCRPPL